MKYESNDFFYSEERQLTEKNNNIQIKKERNSSFELLRIIMITLIVLHHIFINTISLRNLKGHNYNMKYILLKIISNYGQFGNNVFIMISGYFSVSKTIFNLNKFLNILLEIYTYYYPSILIGKRLSLHYRDVKFPNYSSYKIYFPNLTGNGNWFIQSYLCLLIFTPFINTGLLSLNKKKYRELIIMIIIFYCIFNPVVELYKLNAIFFATTPFIRLLLPYIIGGYIKIYDLKYKFLWIIIGIGYIILSIFSEIFFDKMSFQYKNFNFILLKLNLTYNMNSLFSIIGSMGLIYSFKKNNFHSKKINWISASVLGIYLIHGNKHITPYVYNIWFKTNNINVKYFFVKYIVKGFLIIILSLVLDLIRRYN